MYSEAEHSNPENHVQQKMGDFRQAFLEVRDSFGFEDAERLGLGIYPALHQDTGEYPFQLLEIIGNNGTRQVRAVCDGAPWHGLAVTSPSSESHVRTVVGYEVVAPQINTEDRPAYALSIHIPQGWPLVHPESGIADKALTEIALHPLLLGMSTTAFRGGISLELAIRLEGDEYLKMISKSRYTYDAMAYSMYMGRAIGCYVADLGVQIDQKNIPVREAFKLVNVLQKQALRYFTIHHQLHDLQKL